MGRMRWLVMGALAAGCGGGGTGTTTPETNTTKATTTATTTATATSGIASAKAIGTLTDAEKKRFCDWTAGLYGGYGQVRSCDPATSGTTATITAPASQAECLAMNTIIKPTCAATVAEAEGCIAALSTCDPSDEDTQCPVLFACYTLH